MITTCTHHSWTAPDDETFPYSLWSADSPRAIVIAIHGLSGAALDYEPLGQSLLRHGVTTFAPDLRGQGNDVRTIRRGDLERLEDWYADLHAFFTLVRQSHPGIPIYAYGESMGAALLTRFLAQADEIDQPRGLILASPVIGFSERLPWWQELLFRIFLWVRPGHRVDVRKWAKPKANEAPKYVTRDETHRKWFETASHKLDRFTLRFFKNLHDLIDGCFAAAPRLRLPIMVLYAARDIFITPAKVEEFFALLPGPDKELTLFPEAYHLLLHDHDKDQVLARIETWLLARMK